MEYERYNLILHYDNGMTAKAKDVGLDLFDDSHETIYLYGNHNRNFVDVTFNTTDCVFDTDKMVNIVHAEDLSVDYMDFDDEEGKALVAEAKKANILYMTISRQYRRDIHYAV